MDATDPRHGTTKGYHAGCGNPCCREARNKAERTRRKHRDVLGIVRAIPATGTVRRIHALMALGWRSGDIADRCGWTHGNAVLEIASRTWVERKTETAIAAVYDELSMTLGPSAQTRTRAERKGWAPPLAWDDIDDPNATPNLGRESHTVATARTTQTPGAWAEASAARLQDIQFMADSHVSIEEAARRLNTTVSALEKWLNRENRSDLYSRMLPRDHNNKTNVGRSAA